MTDLLELAERCEQASGADREIDARIWCHLEGHRFIKMAKRGDTWGEIEGNDRGNTLIAGWVVFENLNYDPRRDAQFQQYSCDHGDDYTHSLDAAMTLVPEGHYFEIGGGGDSGAIVWDGCDDKPDLAAIAATPALALCAAALRARHALSLDQPKEEAA